MIVIVRRRQIRTVRAHPHYQRMYARMTIPHLAIIDRGTQSRPYLPVEVGGLYKPSPSRLSSCSVPDRQGSAGKFLPNIATRIIHRKPGVGEGTGLAG